MWRFNELASAPLLAFLQITDDKFSARSLAIVMRLPTFEVTSHYYSALASQFYDLSCGEFLALSLKNIDPQMF
jgi:hypothetical protein